MNILFCSDPINNKEIDTVWHQEYIVAKQYGVQTHCLNYEALTEEKNINNAMKRITKPSQKELCIYRGWMMSLENYEALYFGLLERNLQLINSPKEFKNCHYFPEYYELINSMTPQTICTNKKNLCTRQFFM